MENQRKLKWEELKEQLQQIEMDQVICLLEYEWNRLQQESFMEGYEYAITVLQESVVKK